MGLEKTGSFLWWLVRKVIGSTRVYRAFMRDNAKISRPCQDEVSTHYNSPQTFFCKIIRRDFSYINLKGS